MKNTLVLLVAVIYVVVLVGCSSDDLGDYERCSTPMPDYKDDCGFAEENGYMADDEMYDKPFVSMQEELRAMLESNPWWREGDVLESLPVFANTVRRYGDVIWGGDDWHRNLDDDWVVGWHGWTDEEMVTEAERIATALELEIEEMQWHWRSEIAYEYSERTVMVFASDYVDIRVSSSGVVRITFGRPPLPEHVERAIDGIEYAVSIDKVALAFGFELPTLVPNRTYPVIVFDNSGDYLEERILNYVFSAGLWIARQSDSIVYHSHDVLLSHKIGAFPIITLQEALERLMDGDFITFFGDTPPPLESIIHVSIAYQQRTFMDVFTPFYAFTIENYVGWSSTTAWVSALPDYVLEANPHWGSFPLN